MSDQVNSNHSSTDRSSTGKPTLDKNHSMSAEIPQIKQPQKTPAILRTLPLIILTGVFVGWGFLSKIPVKVVGQSIVLIPRTIVPFQSRNSGRVIELNVKVGDQVKKDQVLAIIEASELQEELENKRQQLAEYEQENIAITDVENRRSQVKQEGINSQQQAIPIEVKANEEQIKSNQQEQVAIERQRKTYEQRLQQIDEIDQLISARFEAYNELVAEGAIAPLDSSRIQAEDVLQRNLNEKTELLAKLEDLKGKYEQLTAQNQSLMAQNQSLIAQKENLIAQSQEIVLDDLESDIKRRNTIDNLKRDIANTEVQLLTTSQVVSAYDGEITKISVNPGQFLETGTTLGTIKVAQPEDTQEIALAFFTPEDADRITPGMNVEVTPNLLTERRFGGTRERFGGIIGTITHVSQGTMTPDEVTSIVGNPDLAQALITNPVPYSAPDPGAAENLPVVQVEVKLERNPNNVTGYEWVRGKEPNHPIPEGAIGEARVTIESRSPVNYLEPLLRWITGIYSH